MITLETFSNVTENLKKDVCYGIKLIKREGKIRVPTIIYSTGIFI